MARITVEDCLNRVDNRFGLIHLAAKRVRQLKKDAEPMVVCKNKDIVVALREIAAGEVFQTKSDDEHHLIETSPESLLDSESLPESESLPDSESQQDSVPETPDLETNNKEAPEEK